MAANDWFLGVPAPRDANGSPVPLGTRELVYKGETRKVCGFSYSTVDGCWGASFVDGNDINVKFCTIPDNWERLEEDARKTPRDYTEGRGIAVGSDGRVAAMCKDIVSRAKALAGVRNEG